MSPSTGCLTAPGRPAGALKVRLWSYFKQRSRRFPGDSTVLEPKSRRLHPWPGPEQRRASRRNGTLRRRDSRAAQECGYRSHTIYTVYYIYIYLYVYLAHYAYDYTSTLYYL